MINHTVYKKLDWDLLVQKLANYCQTQEGVEQSLSIKPELPKEEILTRWSHVSPLKELFGQGYRAPIGEIFSIIPLLKAAGLGIVLEGSQLRSIFDILEAVKKVHGFAQDFSERCSTLNDFKKNLVLLTNIYKAIEKSIDKDGKLLDTASIELDEIRKQKRNLNRKIEQKLKEILHHPNWELYIQDDFYTVRSDRYVVPIKLDGRGRVRGAIIDTSESGQTLYIEPTAIIPLNQSLQDLDLSEKLEIIRILRQLSLKIAQESEALKKNYHELIRLDLMSAEAQLAFELAANPINISDIPEINLIEARHPLVSTPEGARAIPNSIELKQEHSCLIISGPNAGGKTVVLKTLGTALLMLKSGLLIPAKPESSLFLFQNLFLEMGDSQSLTANLSTFSGHIQSIKPIVDQSQNNDLILLDELAVGTEPQTGAAIAQAIIEQLVQNRGKTLVTTHYDNLKSLALHDQRYRNASMEYSIKNFRPTYKLTLDIPGQSYGLELASQIGLPKSLISRAKELRGESISSLDDAILQLSRAKSDFLQQKNEFQEAKDAADAEKVRWQQEVALLETTRQKTSLKLKERYQKELSLLKDNFDSIAKEIRTAYKQAVKEKNHGLVGEFEKIQKTKQEAKEELAKYQKTLGELSERNTQTPLKSARFEDLDIGDLVLIIPFGRKGKISKMGLSAQDKIEIQAGFVKLKASVKDLHLIKKNIHAKKKEKPRPKPLKENPREAKMTQAPLNIKTSTNSIDLRGMEVEQALNKTWKFIDAAVLRGEEVIILIHGHGTNALKSAIRKALAEDCPYDLKFHAGKNGVDGDGTTIVYFKD